MNGLPVAIEQNVPYSLLSIERPIFARCYRLTEHRHSIAFEKTQRVEEHHASHSVASSLPLPRGAASSTCLFTSSFTMSTYRSSASGNTFDVKIRSWHGVASWTWGGDDVCAICHGSFDQSSPDAKYPGDDSAVAWGKCKHAFHISCIQKHLMQDRDNPTKRCPVCRQDWEYFMGNT